MAAKLKKRALAEYQSQVLLTEDSDKPETSSGEGTVKKLRLQNVGLKTRLSRSISSSSKARTSSQSTECGATELPSVLGLDKITKPQELATAIVQITPRILSRSLDKLALQELIFKLTEFGSKRFGDSILKSQIYLCLSTIMNSYLALEQHGKWRDGELEEMSSFVKSLLKDRCDEWGNQASQEKDHQVCASILSLLADWYGYGQRLSSNAQAHLLEMAREALKREGHLIKISALRLLGAGLSSFTATDRGLAHEIVSLVGKYTLSSEPRVRSASFESLLEMNKRGHKLDMALYKDFCSALNDDYDVVRKAAIRLIFLLASTYPEETVPTEHDKNGELRLADDAFGKICNTVNDLSVRVREEAMILIGNMENVSEVFLEQTFDKKLISNMRVKKSSHERVANRVAAGEWSTGQNWNDDQPREEVDPESVELISNGACGAFVHGLEDELMAVRSQAIKSLTKQSLRNPKIASIALDYLVDMFNDEIEIVRLEAIESLTLIANYITLQVHQLETILSALDDFSVVVREKLHIMLQASTIATKDGLESVTNKLLENLKRYPQDRRSILATFKKLGLRHANLTLPLVSQLLVIHPFFDTTEPDIEDPAYQCILVMVFNASSKCPTLGPLLDHHTKRHYHYLVNTYPHLVSYTETANTLDTSKATTTTTNFFKQVLNRVSSSSQRHINARISVLEQARQDLLRLGSIEPSFADPSTFAQTYINCQCIILKCLARQFWLHPRALQPQESEIVEKDISELFNLCAQLENRFINLSQKEMRQIKLLKLSVMALHLVYLVRASNKSALTATEMFLREAERLRKSLTPGEIDASPFFSSIIKKLAEEEERKPGVVVRLVQPLLLNHPVESLELNTNVSMCHAVIYEPTGNNETPLRYTAGMVLAVPVDAELFNLSDEHAKMVRLCIKSPDQKSLLVTPMSSQFFKKDESCRRLLTNAIMSHQVWSEALHVELSIVLDMSEKTQDKEGNHIIELCKPVKVYVLPKAIKRGI